MYEFNDCKVCINPEEIKLVDKSYIKIAEADEGFVYGFTIDYNTGGRCSPCMLGGKYYPTRQKAIDEALQDMKREVQVQIEWYSQALEGIHEHTGYDKSLSDCKRVLKAINEKINNNPKPIQLELFNF